MQLPCHGFNCGVCELAGPPAIVLLPRIYPVIGVASTMGICGVSGDFTESLIGYLPGSGPCFPHRSSRCPILMTACCHCRTRKSIDRGHNVPVSSKSTDCESCRQDPGTDSGGNGVSCEPVEGLDGIHGIYPHSNSIWNTPHSNSNYPWSFHG